MSKNTINFGIDLGTTNSVIAWLNDNGEVQIFKNYLQSEITPSVVRIDEKGTVTVGRKAYERLFDDPDNTASEFKRLMGTQSTKKFKLSNKELKPEELSVEVLKDLKISAKDQLPESEEINCAVITVPCNFEIVQCEATQRAAKLAGIQYAPLLQEPIAASVAYGFLEKMPTGYWVVFDLGGGTFDVAILSSKEGNLGVVDHAGDNFLGGKEFDWKIVEKIIHPVLSKEYNLPLLGRTKEYASLNAFLKATAEEAKIELSRREETNIIVFNRDMPQDKDGKTIDINIPIKRSHFESIISNEIEKTIELFANILKTQGLSSNDINQLLLVGGSTQIPYLRNRLKERFNIPMNYKIDPMTVVAQGAAIFAGAQFVPDKIRNAKRDYSKVFVKLAYNPMTTDTETPIGGKIYPKKGESLPADLRVQIVSLSGDWDSGHLETKENAFYTEVFLHPNKTNIFKLNLWDNEGNKIDIEPDTFSISQGMDVSNPPLIRSIGVELTDGTFSIHLKKGDRLPAKKKFVYYTTSFVSPGEEKDAINILVREGEGDIASRNRHLGTLQIKGDDLDQDLPEGSEIEISLSVDESRSVSVEAYSPLLDKKFSEILYNKVSPKLEVEQVEDVFNAILDEMSELNKKIDKTNDENIKNVFTKKRVESDVEEIKKDIKIGREGDSEAIEKADRRIKELGQKIDTLGALLEWPIVFEEYNDIFSGCKNVVEKFGEDEDMKNLINLEEEANKAINNKDHKYLKKINENIIGLYWNILFRLNDFWISEFQRIKNNPDRFENNRGKAEQLIDEGNIAIHRKDYESLRSIVVEFWRLMPEQKMEKLGSRINISNIRK